MKTRSGRELDSLYVLARGDSIQGHAMPLIGPVSDGNQFLPIFTSSALAKAFGKKVKGLAARLIPIQPASPELWIDLLETMQADGVAYVAIDPMPGSQNNCETIQDFISSIDKGLR